MTLTTGCGLAGPTILPVALRRPAGVVAVLAVVVFGAFAARYGGGSSARWLDRRDQSIVGSSDAPQWMPDVVIGFGNELPVVVLALLLSGLALALGHRRLAVLPAAVQFGDVGRSGLRSDARVTSGAG
jgi:hypothetical protein